jgi:hypothetical protein
MENENPMSSLPCSQRLKLYLDSMRAEIAKTADEPFTWEEFLTQLCVAYLHYVCDMSKQEIKNEIEWDTELWEQISGILPIDEEETKTLLKK